MRRVAEPEEVSGKAHVHLLYSLNSHTAQQNLLLLHGCMAAWQKSCDLLHHGLVRMRCADPLYIWHGQVTCSRPGACLQL